MKILFIDPLFTKFGGGQVISYNTYLVFKNKGHDVYFWAQDKKPYFEEDYKYQKYFTSYNCGPSYYIRNPFKYYYNLEARNDLQKFIDLIKPDLVHIHGIFGISSSILKCCKDIPTVMTLHDPSFACPATTFLKGNNEVCKEGYCKNGSYLPLLLNRCSKGKLEPSLRWFIKSHVNLRNIKYADKFVTPSEALRKIILRANIGIKENDIVTVNNFLSKKEFNIAPNYYNNKGYFLYLGRLSKEKGVHYLLETIKNLPFEIEFHIVGDGPDYKKLTDYAQRHNLNVKFLGYLNREQINNEYQECIACVLPCNWFETFGMTNIESFINGKPVIASNVGGIPEIVEDNVNGLLFEAGNVEQLKKCIIKYWNNLKLAVEHGKNGYQKVITQYSEDRYYQELIKVYEEAINECRK